MLVPGSANPLLLRSAAPTAYQVSRSLRFNSADSAYLSRVPSSTSTTTTWTWSAWVKRSTLGSKGLFGAYYGNMSRYFLLRFSSSDQIDVFGGDYSTGSTTTNVNLITTSVYRDTSAWMHIVFTYDTTNGTSSDRARLYVNNTRVTTFSTAVYPGSSSSTFVNYNTATHYLGAWWTGSEFFDGYLANVEFVDGSALTPSSFAETDATTSQWVPKQFSGSYGSQGWKLTFADNSNNTASTLGADSSGNGNHWSPTNLSVIQGNGNYVPQMTSSGGLTYGTTFLNGFDGNITNGVYGPAGGTMTFTPTPAISYSTSVEVITFGDSNSRASLNGGSAISTPNNTWTTLASGSGSITSIVFSDSAGGEPGFSAIRVDGVILVDYRAASANDSLTDSPTSYGSGTSGGDVRGNFCTWNPLNKSANTTLSNGNLNATATVADWRAALGTFGMSSGKWYWELTITGAYYHLHGIAKAGINLGSFVGFDANGWGYYGSTGGTYNSSSLINTSTFASYTTGDVIGVAFDADNGSLYFYKNGTVQNSGTAAYTGLTSGPYFPACSHFSSTNTDVNFGQRAFAYTPPANFKPLVDTYLPTPTVAKPSEVMDVKLYTGTGSSQTITGLSFNPDFLWFKSRGFARHHALIDQVRGGNKLLGSSITDAEGTYNDMVTAFNSNGFTLGADATTLRLNESGYAYVAWAWDAGSSTVTNTQGSISSQVRANASAGFSIVTWTGNGTVGHGLGVAPVLYIWKRRNLANNWGFNFTFLDGSLDYMYLNLTNAKGDATQAAPTSTVITIPSGDMSSTDTGVLYAFSPVAGYSSFGSFSGGSGVFVHTGFLPRWVLLKQSSASSSWIVYDTARDTYNVMGNSLYPNLSDAEISSPPRIDFLSNGFITRASSGSEPSWTGTVIYAAFAQNCFQYARAR